jgi:hypothetical protein
VAGDVLKYHYKGEERIQEVPEQHVWLLGDNSENSHDSREYGPVSRIRGRVFCKIGLRPTFHCEHIDTPTGLKGPDRASLDPDLEVVERKDNTTKKSVERKDNE